jgi:hydrogenase maturation factor HypF (carbamoyltransferase family)
MARSCGHFATKSRRYSTTRKALKHARRQWRRIHHHAHAQHHTAEHTEEETTLIVGALSFAGSGYRSTGDQWLALTAAAQAREQRQIAKEERNVAGLSSWNEITYSVRDVTV